MFGKLRSKAMCRQAKQARTKTRRLRKTQSVSIMPTELALDSDAGVTTRPSEQAPTCADPTCTGDFESAGFGDPRYKLLSEAS